MCKDNNNLLKTYTFSEKMCKNHTKRNKKAVNSVIFVGVIPVFYFSLYLLSASGNTSNSL